MTFARECEHCGGPIPDHKRADAMYCSKACQKLAYSEIEKAGRLEDKANRPPCQHCGAAIPAEAMAFAIYCSVHCQRRGIYHKTIAARPLQTCPACGAGFRARSSTGVQTYCSAKCAQTHGQKGAAIDCQHCGTHIETPRRGQKFCNPRCQDRWHKAQRRTRKG